MKAESTEFGMNKTGCGTSPLDAKETIEGATVGEIPSGDETQLFQAEMEYLSNGSGPVGSVPIPTSVKGAVKAAAKAIKGQAPAVLLDRLGERLAFERTATRLYEAIRLKFDASKPFDGGPTRELLERFHNEELSHFLLVKEVIEKLGGDPTAQTPSADLQGVTMAGVHQVVGDPRTNLLQCLEALLTAELTDGEGWQVLVDLTRSLGEDELSQKFAHAEGQEAVHIANVRRWVSHGTLGEATRQKQKKAA